MKDRCYSPISTLAPDPEQTKLLKDSGCIAIAYETVTDDNGHLPLLSPMSEVAGRMSIQAVPTHSKSTREAQACCWVGVPGVEAARVVVIGGGVVGTNAIRMAMGMEAHVTVLDRSLDRLKELDFQFGCMLNTIYSTRESFVETRHHGRPRYWCSTRTGSSSTKTGDP